VNAHPATDRTDTKTISLWYIPLSPISEIACISLQSYILDAE